MMEFDWCVQDAPHERFLNIAFEVQSFSATEIRLSGMAITFLEIIYFRRTLSLEVSDVPERNSVCNQEQ